MKTPETNSHNTSVDTSDLPQPSHNEAFLIWGKIGILSFGGPAAQIALMHKTIVEEQKWLDERNFLNALNFCMLLPGPEAMQLATYIGWRLQGVWGGLISGLLFVLPGAAIILALAILYAEFGTIPLVSAAFLGIKSAVLIIVIEALIKIARKALSDTLSYWIAGFTFIALFFFKLPYPLIVLTTALIGFFWAKRQTQQIQMSFSNIGEPVNGIGFLKTISIWLGLWFAPIAGLWLGGANEILLEIATFFSKLAIVTFGGAYAVLAYMAQDVVQAENWISGQEMIDALGLAETTPGPLILVTQFVGFLAAERVGGLSFGIAGAAITLWVTFIPCFLWIFAFAPYIEKISAQPRLRSALAAITAAVVGVILNLTLWFAMQIAFRATDESQYGPLTLTVPNWQSFDWRVAVLTGFAALLILLQKTNLLIALMLSALAGMLLASV